MDSECAFRSLDDFSEIISSKDTNVRLEVYNQLESFLKQPHCSMHCTDLNSFCNSIMAWVSSSNFKISINGLTIIQLLIEQMHEKLQNYCIDIIVHIVDRLGDSKEQVRAASKNILLFMMATYGPSFIWDRLNAGFNHKIAKIREETLDLLIEAFDKFGAGSMHLGKMVTFVVKLMTDPNQFVRERALVCLVEVYKTVGDRLRNELKKKQLPEEKVKLIFSKFDDVLKHGKMKESSKPVKSSSSISLNKNSTLETSTGSTCVADTTSTSSVLSSTTTKTMQRPQSKIAVSKSSVPPRASSSSAVRSVSLSRCGTTSKGGAGAVDENVFLSEFDKAPPINVYSSRDVDQHINQICEALGNAEDWAGRMNALKRVRGLVIASRENYESEVYEVIRKTAAQFTAQTKDLRSQVVREACITLAYLAQTFGNKLDIFMEVQMANLINLLQNSAKIMATSSLIALRFIIENVHSAKLIPFITNGFESRSKEIRRACCEYLHQMLQTWDTHYLERSVQILSNAIKKGVLDADADARVLARKAFWSFRNHFPSQADALFNSFEKKVKNLLSSGAQGQNGSVKSLVNACDNTDSRLAAPVNSKIKRSTSAVDIKNPRSTSSLKASEILAANELENTDLLKCDDFSFDLASRSSLFTQIKSAKPVHKLRPGSRIPMPNSTEPVARTPVVTPRIAVPTPSKSTSRIVQSQPGSRSTSPTPKYNYITNNLNSSYSNGHTSPLITNSILNNLSDLASTPPPSNYAHVKSKVNSGLSNSGGSAKSRIPTSSRNSSRESSPGRRSNYGSERRASASKTPSKRFGVRTLSNSQEGESVMAHSISNKYSFMKMRSRRWDDMSDEASETSSLCSERSFSSSIGGNRVTEVREMNETITLLNSNQWNEKRDGLANIKLMMQSNRLFTRQELKRLCDIFGKLFSENNNKVFATFMETLEMFIRLNKTELKDWLAVLLPKLLHRLGLETSQNQYSKLCTCLEAIRSSFDIDHQFKVLVLALTQTSNDRNPKWKVAILKYLQDIICLLEPVDFQINDEFKSLLKRVVALTTDPKSQEARRASQAVIIGLFNLNTSEFSMLMNEMPINIQQTCTEVLKQHMKNLNIEPSRVKKSPTAHSNLSKLIKPASQFLSEYVSENSAQLSHVIKDIHNLNMNTNFYKANGKKLDTLSKDSGVQSNVDADSDSDGATSSASSHSKLANINQILPLLNPNQSNPATTSEKLKAMKDLTELIKAGNRPESNWQDNFKNVLLYLFHYLELISSSSSSSSSSSTSSSSSPTNENTIDQSLYIQTLLCVRELLQFHYKEFKDYIEVTIIKLFSNYKETPQNELYKLVEEVIYTAARCLPPESTSRVLKPIIEQAEYPRNLIAIRMLQKTVEQMSQDMGNRLLHDILPALLHAWDSPHSPVRKASVFCLVSLYMTIGEELRHHLVHLSSSKLKLLNVYINRAKESRDQPSN